MPFDAAFNDIYKLGIKAAGTAAGIDAQRVDEQIYSEGILERIYQQIRTADIVIADMSGQNANVFYEVGYAHGINKLCILLTQRSEDIPFDLKHRRHIVYGSSIVQLKDELTANLKWAATEVKNARKSRLRVALAKIGADLKKDKFKAVASVTVSIDLHNESEAPSAEIETLYLYTGVEWEIFQNDAKCSVTASDLSSYKFRYFLTSPVRRLQKRSWAQLNLTMSRTMATVWKGDVLQSSYMLSGRVTLRIVTNEGHFDHELLLQVEAAEVPF